MKTMEQYVDDLKAAHNIPSDRQLALFLGLKKQSVSHWKRRGVTVDPDTAWKIAEGLGIDPLEVIAASEVERARRTHNEARERVWLERLQHVSASFSLAFVLLVASLPAVSGVQHCILC